MQMAGDIANPEMQAHFVRNAKIWTDEAERETAAEITGRGFSVKPLWPVIDPA
jgi:hypothetical protein